MYTSAQKKSAFHIVENIFHSYTNCVRYCSLFHFAKYTYSHFAHTTVRPQYPQRRIENNDTHSKRLHPLNQGLFIEESLVTCSHFKTDSFWLISGRHP